MKTKTQEAYKIYCDESAALHAKFEAVAKAEFPEGSRVAWKVSGHQQIGRIVRYQWGSRVLIRNERTGREVAQDVQRLQPVEG